MSEVVATAIFTLAGGVVFFAFSQLATELVLGPLAAFRKTRGDIAFALVFHGNIIASTRFESAPEKCEAASLELRRLSARIRADANSIWLYSMLSMLRIVPSMRDVSEAAGLLIRLSNITGSSEHWDLKFEDKRDVESLLKLELNPKSRTNRRSQRGADAPRG